MYCVELSARLIRWPGVCACCCRPADTTVEIASTRVTGKRVIHTQTKAWEVPYCRKCLTHIKASRELAQFSTFVLHLSVPIGLLGFGSAGVILLGIVHRFPGLAILLSILAGAATIAALVLTYRWCQDRYEREVSIKRRQRQELLDRLGRLLCADCAEQDRLAAKYGGWCGTVHTFYFASDTFASYVEAANPGKCLRQGRRHHGRH